MDGKRGIYKLCQPSATVRPIQMEMMKIQVAIEKEVRTSTFQQIMMPGFDSSFLGRNQTLQTISKHVCSELQKDSELIVLSDSEEENANDVNIG